MNRPLKILLLEDNPDDVDLERHELRKLSETFTLQHVETKDDYCAQLVGDPPDIILADYSLPQYDGMSALAEAQNWCSEVPFIFVSGTIGEEVAIDALQRGAVDYVTKQRLHRLVPAVERALREAEGRRRHREAEAEHARTRHQLEAFINYSPAMISMKDTTGKFLLTNRLFNEQCGGSSDTLEGKQVEDWLSAEDAAVIRQTDEQVIAQGMPLVEEVKLDLIGTSRTFLSIKFPIYDQDRNLEGIGSIDAEITDHKLAEQTLRHQARLLDQASDAIYVTDLEGKFTYGNLAAEKKSGWVLREIQGREIPEVFADITPEKLALVRVEVEQKGLWQDEVMIRNKAGDPLWIDLRVSPLREANGALSGHMLIGTDVTEKRELAEQFLRVQRMENIGMLAAGIAHDFNNVLAPIGMVATLLRGQLTGDRNLRFLETLEKSAERGAGLVRQIMGFVHGVDAGARELQTKHLLRDVTEMMNETFPKNITLQESIPSDLWVIKGNPTQIHQILLNLCVNARDAMPAGGTLSCGGENVVLDQVTAATIPHAHPGSWLVLKVADTGTGMPREMQEKIWAPFFSTKTSDKGTGLGLSTVRGIVEQHRGFIHLKSAPGEGSTFSVYLPAEGAGKESVETPVDTRQASGRGEVVLVVDDEPLVLEATSHALREAGYKVVEAADGLEAARLFMEQPTQIDLVLTDLEMPKLNGVELIAAVHATNPAVKIVVMSGKTLSEVHFEPPVERAVAALLAKPFETAQLLRVVHDELSKRTTPPFPLEVL